jgi:hypothetical protein
MRLDVRGSILDVAKDRHLFGPWFYPSHTWQAWFAFLAALFALPMTHEQWALYRQCTGRRMPPRNPAREAWIVVGRRGGKSFILALIAVYISCFVDHRLHLSRGERGTVMIIATDRRQARAIFQFIQGFLRNVPLLSKVVERETAQAFELENNIRIEIHTASFRSTRGYAIVACLLDELAYWKTETSTEPDYEIINAVRPGMAQFPNALLIGASSPYARRGALWEAYAKHFGAPTDNVLVWQADTRLMNPKIPEAVIREAMAKDPARAAAEYGAEFRSDIEGFVSREAVDACVEVGMLERAPLRERRYFGFVDPSGGSRDSFTLAIAHRDAGSLFVDAVREVRPPFSPEAVVAEFAATLRAYNVSRVTGDHYGGDWPPEQFRKCGIIYERCKKPKSDLYRDLLPLLNSRRVTLLDHARLLAQLVGLERKTGRSGKDSIDHAPAAYDDVANAVAGALAAAQNADKQKIRMGVYGYGGGPITWLSPAHERPVIRWITVPESEAPAAKGP